MKSDFKPIRLGMAGAVEGAAKMAKKKTPAQELPLEQQPLFLKTLEYLPADRGELEQLARDMLELFNDAMVAGSARDIETSVLRYKAVVYRLNGDTFMGCATEEAAGGQLVKLLAAPAGVVPGWGQSGQYLLEVDDMRLRVKVDPWRMGGTQSLNFHAVDASAKFISETGYLSQFLHADKHVGKTFGQAVRALVEQLLQDEFRPKAIREEERAKITVPAWLVPALQGVTRNGQLNMPLSGEALLPEPVEKGPMSNAERQRLHRQRQKKLAETEGLKVIPLTQEDRMVLSLGLLAHEDLFHRPKDWETTKKPGFDALLNKLWPEGDGGRYLAEPERSTRRPAGFLHDELKYQRERVTRLEIENRALRAGERATDRAEIERLKAALNEIAAEVGAPVTAPVVRTLEGKPTSLDELNREVEWVVRELNKSTAEADALRVKVATLERDNLLLESERNKAFGAIATWENRLRNAGLSTDYRAQSGE